MRLDLALFSRLFQVNPSQRSISTSCIHSANMKQVRILPHSLLLVLCMEIMAASAFSPCAHHRNSASVQTNQISKSKSALHASPIPGVETPRSLVQKGMQSFRDYDVPSSLAYFDAADVAMPNGRLRPYLWQRGISYYYLDRFAEGSDQFRLDVSVNPLDVEEIVWDIACLARMDGTGGGEFPPERRMALPKGKADRRRIMSTVYSLFRGEDGATEYDLRRVGHEGNISDEFYSLFYLGL